MLSGRNIVCISVPPWKGEYAATIVELMKRLGQHNKVLYVHNPFTIKEFLSALIHRKKFPYSASLGLSSGIQTFATPGGSVYILTPPVLLTNNFLPAGALYNLLARINGWILKRSVNRQLRKLGMTNKLIQVVAFNPALGNFTGRQLGETTLLYHCYDEISQAQWMKKHGGRAETAFMRMADATIVTSQGLYEKKQPLATRCYLVKNAADISLFASAFREQPPARPVAGYIGSLDNRLDYDLLARIIGDMPDVLFRFVGRIVDRQGTERLRQFPNVEFTGPKDLEALPALVQDFSAGLIPFVLNEFTSGIYPLKINEYLAAGLPVVSTRFSYLDDFKNHISIAGNATEFGRMLADEIATDTTGKKRNRQQAAAANTWENRVEELSAIIEKLEIIKETT